MWEDHILRGFPMEAPPYESLWLPFDIITWILVLSAIIIGSLTLLAIEKTWCKMRKEESFKKDGMHLISMATIFLKTKLFQLC